MPRRGRPEDGGSSNVPRSAGLCRTVLPPRGLRRRRPPATLLGLVALVLVLDLLLLAHAVKDWPRPRGRRLCRSAAVPHTSQNGYDMSMDVVVDAGVGAAAYADIMFVAEVQTMLPDKPNEQRLVPLTKLEYRTHLPTDPKLAQSLPDACPVIMLITSSR